MLTNRKTAFSRKAFATVLVPTLRAPSRRHRKTEFSRKAFATLSDVLLAHQTPVIVKPHSAERHLRHNKSFIFEIPLFHRKTTFSRKAFAT